jgi:hypothetical protein
VRAFAILVTMMLAGGCGSSDTFDRVVANGTFADGSPLALNVIPNVAIVPSLQPQVGTVMAVGAPTNGPGDFAGLRIEWVQSAIAAGASFASSPDGPVVFYVVRSLPDSGTNDQLASVVNGGTITFTTVNDKTIGTLANLVLTRDGATLVTVDNGTFQATNPNP